MKTINLKKGKVSLNGAVVEITTNQLLVAAINNVDEKGLSLSENRKRMKLLDIIEDVSEKQEIIEVEDEDFKKLTNLVKVTRYNCTGKFLTEFGEHMELWKDED